jgi:putative spermidine/putrescine transport system permease protein
MSLCGRFSYYRQPDFNLPTAYWVHYRMPRWRPIVEFFTLMPFVVPAVVLVFGMARLYSRVSFMVELPVLLIGGYVVLSFPYMFRAVDAGLRAIDVRTLTEAAQSLGAGWRIILFQVIFPNLRVAILSSVSHFRHVMGEFTFASLLSFDAFGPYGRDRRNGCLYPQALSVISFLITWACIIALQRLAKGAPGQFAGAR